MNRNLPDYCTDKAAALSLVERLKQYYNERGAKGVKVWIEPRMVYSTTGDKIRTYYDIRSNIKFDVSCLQP